MCFLVDVGDSLACRLMVRGRNNLKLFLWKIQLSSLFKVLFFRTELLLKERDEFPRRHS